MTITTYPAEIATAGTIHFSVALTDANGELYTVDPFADPAVVIYKNGAAYSPTSVTVTQRGSTQVYDVAVAYTGLTAGDYLTLEPSVQMVEGQTMQLPSGVCRAATPVDLSSVTDAIDTMRGADSDTLKTLSEQLDATSSTLAGVFDDADVAAMVTAILNAIETGLDGSDVSVQAIAARVRVELATELARIDVATSTRSSHTAANVKTAIEAGGSSLAQILTGVATDVPALIAALSALVEAIKTKSDQLAFTSGKVHSQVKGIDTDAIAPAAVKNFRLRDVGDTHHTDLIVEETP